MPRLLVLILLCFLGFAGGGRLVSGLEVACVEACADDDCGTCCEDGTCAPDCDDCACCARTLSLVSVSALSIPAVRALPTRDDVEGPAQAVSSVDPREIPHVPIGAIG